MSLHEERIDRRGRRTREVRLEEMDRPYERRRPQFPRRSSSAGPLVVSSRNRNGGGYERAPREWHDHEEVHGPYRGSRRHSPAVVETERERDRMYLRRSRSRPRRKMREIETEYEVDAEPRVRRSRTVPDESDEIIISRERENRERTIGVEREEVVVRHRHDRSLSTSSESSIDEPPIIRAPPIHQDVITHHRHVEHGYAIPERPRRVPQVDEIEVRERRDRTRRESELVVRTATPPRRREEVEVVVVQRDRGRRYRSLTDLREEAAYYDRIALERESMGEAYHGATRDWTIVDVPPGTKRVTMDGIGGGAQEISWQRYNGARRSRFLPNGSDDYEETSVRRYAGGRDRRDHPWTEITKDLVIKDVIDRSGYEYEETDRYYYVNAPLAYEDVASLVRSSDDYRRRRERVREVRIESPPRRALPAPDTSTVIINRSRPFERERVEREVVTEEWGTPPRYSYL